jgi:P27 family predicted phage terminase small subunit
MGRLTGPKPKPGAIKKLQGNPGKRPIKDDLVTSYDENVPDPPDTLNELGKTEWKRVSPILHEMKLLANLDLVALEAYCVSFVQWRESNAQLSKYGLIIKSPNGYPMQSPYLSISKGALADMARFMAEFGMTPSSRGRLNVQEKEKGQEEEIESFLKAGKKLKAVK